MRRIALIATMSISIFANAVLAQQSGAKPESEEQDGLPTVAEQLKVLNEKLGLTAKQQAKVKPILQQMHDPTENVMRDKTLSREERLSKVRPQRQMVDKKMRAILNDNQRKRLHQYEQGPHREVHGTLSGTPKPPARYDHQFRSMANSASSDPNPQMGIRLADSCHLTTARLHGTVRLGR